MVSEDLVGDLKRAYETHITEVIRRQMQIFVSEYSSHLIIDYSTELDDQDLLTITMDHFMYAFARLSSFL